MDKRLSVIRAAKLAGVPRAELQARIRRGELEAFDGTVRADELLRLYPEVRLQDERMLERIEEIKAQALGRDIAARSLPDPKILARRLSLLGDQLTRARELADHYAGVLEHLEKALRECEVSQHEPVRDMAQDLRRRVQSVLHQRRGGAGALGDVLDMGIWMSVMAPQVRLLPDNQEFLVEGADTILEAALRSGLAIRYGCSNGACGECMARVVSGEVRTVRPHDRVLSEQERKEGYALMCSSAPITDLVIEMGVAQSPEQIPTQTVEVTVRDLQFINEMVLQLKVQTPRTRRLRFLGGQYVRVQALPDGPSAYLPLGNCPCDDRNLAFHLVAERHDAFAQYCRESLRKGDVLRIDGPFGDFVLGHDLQQPLILLGCDAGFAPLKSLIEHRIALNTSETLHLIWVASAGVGHYLENLCHSWEDALEQIRFRPLTVANNDPAAYSAALSEGLARVPEPSQCQFMIAGPLAFLEVAEKLLTAQGVPADQCHWQSIPPQPPQGVNFPD